jgi:hypothetical protein
MNRKIARIAIHAFDLFCMAPSRRSPDDT